MIPAFDHSYHEIMLGSVPFVSTLADYVGRVTSYRQIMPARRFELRGSAGGSTAGDGGEVLPGLDRLVAARVDRSRLDTCGDGGLRRDEAPVPACPAE